MRMHKTKNLRLRERGEKGGMRVERGLGGLPPTLSGNDY